MFHDGKYLIVGARKCGTTSLEKFMKDAGIDVKRHEQLFTRIDGVDYFLSHYNDRIPIVILRNPIDRIESDWQYDSFGGFPKPDRFESYCLRQHYNETWGERNPVLQSYYKKWLNNWKKIPSLTIINFHVMIRNGDFPHENKTIPKRPHLIKHQRHFAQKLLHACRDTKGRT